MKEKKCPQCKNLVSITAPTCLYCGRPNKSVTNNYVQRKWNNKNKNDNFNNNKIEFSLKTFLVFLIVFIIFLIIIYK